MTRRLPTAVLAALSLTAALVVPASGPATAAASASPANSSRPTCSRAGFSTAQAFVAAQVTGRVDHLQVLVTRLSGPGGAHLTASDRATLSADLNRALSGLQALAPQVQAATDCAELLGDAATMVRSYWVWLLLTPQVDLTEVADTETDVTARLDALVPRAQNAITRAQGRGVDVTGAQAALSDLQAQLAAASAATSGVAATVLAQTPAGAPGNFSVLTSARASLSSAASDLRAAASDAGTIVSDLG